jgi:hypothetical protein
MAPVVVTQVAPPHSWYGVDVGGSRLLYDNPDTIYRFFPVNKTAEYVVTGRIYEGVPADTTFSVLEGTSGTTSSILALADLDISPDGSFVITVSGEAAAPGQANHLQLTSNSTLIAARNTLGDWVVDDVQGYIARAVAAAGDIAGLCVLRQGLRARLAASPLGNTQAFGAALTDAFFAMWQAKSVKHP